MRLEPFDNGRFLISSGGPWYLFDIMENNGMGWCSCEDHTLRCQPRIDKKEPGRKRCKHGRWLWEVIKTYNARTNYEGQKTNQASLQVTSKTTG